MTRILVVEDEGIVRKDVAERLRYLGYEVIASVGSAADALKKAEEARPDLVLLDIMLSGQEDGIPCAEEIRRRFDIPVVYLTAYADPKTLERAKVTGPYGYILKPFEERDLQSGIEMALYKYGMERRLRESEEKYRTLVEAAHEPIFTVDASGMFTYMNATMAGLLKIPAAEFTPQPVRSLLAESTARTLLDNVGAVLQGGEGRRVEYEVEIGGDRRWLCFSIQPLRQNSGQTALIIASDITSRKAAEVELAESYRKLKETQEQLVHSSKMTAMGQLAAGISHELNQPLTGIKGFAQSALLDVPADSRVHGDLETIVRQCERMEGIINSVRAFARRSPCTISSVDINATIEDVLKLVKAQMSVHNIALCVDLEKSQPRVMGNAGQLQQVFVNLVTNARDAVDSRHHIPGGGRIAIDSRSDGQGKVSITVRDNGCGITRDNLEHVFNPFFTTKQPGGGMGLGLSIAYSIIENHKGIISVESVENEGTAFHILLPAAR